MFKLAVIAVLVATASAVTLELNAQRAFEQFKAEYNKVYATAAEEASRFQIFQDKLAYINKHNAEAAEGKWSYTAGVNQFTDLSEKEFAAYYLNKMLNHTAPKNEVYLEATPNADVDWRTKGAVVGVKDQGQCGSCWAFSAIGAIEGVHAIHNGRLVSLSEEQLCACSWQEGNQGCNGGFMTWAFEYVIRAGGVTTEANYPYHPVDSHNCESHPVEAKISSYINVPQYSGAQLAAAIDKNPVSVAIDAGGMAFQTYRSGTFTGPCGTQLNHGVLAVGYTDAYWIVKNSWGTTWGDAGYIAMSRSVGGNNGICGIYLDSSYPVV